MWQGKRPLLPSLQPPALERMKACVRAKCQDHDGSGENEAGSASTGNEAGGAYRAVVAVR